MFFLPTLSFHSTQAPWENGNERGERKLLLALLKRAVLDYFGANEEEAEAAGEWIFEYASKRRPYSFDWVCDELGLDGERIADRLEHYRSNGQSERITRFLSKAR